MQPSKSLFPNHSHVLNHIGVETSGNGAGVGNGFEFSARGFVGCGRGGQRHGNFDAGNTPGRFGSHDFGHGQGTAGEFDTVAPGKNRHRRDDARAEGIGNEVGRGEGFAPALIVCRCISVDVGARLEVLAVGAKVAEVVNLNRWHKESRAHFAKHKKLGPVIQKMESNL
jgi:hypothetical protein